MAAPKAESSDLTGRGRDVGFFRGMAAFVGGVGWIASTPRLWLRAAAPMATALVLVGAFGVLGVRGAMSIAHRALGDGLGAGFVGMLLAFAAVVLAIVMGVSLAQPLSGWALDGIVRAQERELGSAPATKPPLLASMLGSLASALLGLAVGVPLIVMLTLAAWVVPPAGLVTVPLKLVVAAVLLAWDLLDYPLALHGLGVVARLKWCAHHFSAVVGFGLAALLLFAVPGFGLLALPCGVAGAVRLVADRAPREAPGPTDVTGSRCR
ncbi:MAG: EI24 domain-containing protein [Polyangiaceae bacterium]|jgi:CysZ protein